jgi:hypothetical protein
MTKNTKISDLRKEIDDLKMIIKTAPKEMDTYNLEILNEYKTKLKVLELQLTQVESDKKLFLEIIGLICETEGWTNHNNPQSVITIDRLKRVVKQDIEEEMG